MPGNLLILLCDPPFQYESAEQAIELAEAALRKNLRVSIFLMMDGVYNPVTTQNGAPFRMRSISERFVELLERGVRISACRVCLELRGVTEGMMPKGVDIGGIADYSEMVSDADVIVSFVRRD